MCNVKHTIYHVKLESQKKLCFIQTVVKKIVFFFCQIESRSNFSSVRANMCVCKGNDQALFYLFSFNLKESIKKPNHHQQSRILTEKFVAPYCLSRSLTGLEISTCKLAKCEWFFEVASLKNSQVPSFASKKNLTSKTLLVDKKVKFEPCPRDERERDLRLC